MDQANIEVIDRAETKDAVFEVIQYKGLGGSNDLRVAEKLFFASAAGMRLKQVRVTLKNGRIRNEPGTLFYMNGQLEMKSSTGGGITKALKRKFLSGETALVNEIHGTGSIMLEPTYGHFILLNVDNDTIIVDRSLFFAGSAGLDITAKMVSLSGMVAGGEGIFQTKISGTGVVVLYSPVPMNEITEVDLNNETLSVDGNFAMMRTGGVDFTVRKSARSWVATSVSGEGLLNVFTGTGKVWLAPTEAVYDLIGTEQGLNILTMPPGARNQKAVRES